MDLPQQQTGKFYLKWPWNVVVYVALALLLRIFSIPVILLLMAWNKKQQPDGPEEGYCLQRTRRQLARLGWALLYLLIAACCGVVFFMQLQADRSAWRLEDWAVLAVSGVVAFGGLLLGVYETCTDPRDAFFPERSRLARSIRSQLPYSDEAPDVKELFAMVDRDIRENGQWFDRVAVGREWVLGDDVSAISRIRVVFGRDEIKTRISKNRRQTTRIIELHILDDRRQVQITSLRNPGELEALLACLKLRAPAALFRPYQEFSDYSGKSEEEWATLERAYQRRLTQRQMETVRQEYAAAQGNPAFAFTDLHGQRTSRFDRRTVEEQLSKLQEGAQPISLEILEPIPVPGLHGARLTCLYAGAVHGGTASDSKNAGGRGRIPVFCQGGGHAGDPRDPCRSAGEPAVPRLLGPVPVEAASDGRSGPAVTAEEAGLRGQPGCHPGIYQFLTAGCGAGRGRACQRAIHGCRPVCRGLVSVLAGRTGWMAGSPSTPAVPARTGCGYLR